MDNELDVGPAVVEGGDVCRLRVDVLAAGASPDGEPLWFETADVPLDPGGEGAASALLMATATRGARLHLADPVAGQWLGNVTRMMEVWQKWWGYPLLPPRAANVVSAPRRPAAGRALCFTGGVDSFHTLLHASPRPDVLAFVHGYDIPLADTQRMAAWEPSFREIAAAAGARGVVLRSNLRKHPSFMGSDWERTHGGALAAVGHLLASQVGTLLIASSVPTHYDVHWGSHWQLDEMWSSDRLAVVHFGAGESRFGKVRAIVGDDLAAGHLRVCWENRAATGNCSACDKCVNTMLLIAACDGDAKRFKTFDWSVDLPSRVDRIAWTRFVRTYKEVLTAGGLDRRLTRSVRSLLRRTAGHVTVAERVRRLARRGRSAWRRVISGR